MSTHRTGLVALSADPITYGHLDLIARAAAQCAETVVLVANNDLKLGSYLFTLEERCELARRAIARAKIPNVRVIGSSGLLADVYLEQGCDALFRGIRNAEDKAYEERQMALHALVLPTLTDTVVYLEAKAELSAVSSSMAKAFVAHGLDVSAFVPLFVQEAMQRRINGQFMLGVTGEIAAGKSTLARKLASAVGGHHVDVDALQRSAYAEATPGAQALRDGTASLLGADVLTEDGKDVKPGRMSARIFLPDCPAETREALHRLVAPHVQKAFREAVHGKRGLILVEWAQLAEMELAGWTNNRVLVVESPDRAAFAKNRGIGPERFEAMRGLQWNADKKAAAIQRAIDRDGHGTVLRYENRTGWAGLDGLVAQVRGLFPDLPGGTP